jgi:pyridoxal phosphate enzyme (YggS family)
MPSIAENVAEVRRRIESAARRAGRDPIEVTLVAVSKTVSAAAAAEAINAGVPDLGESRVQEARSKRETLGERGRIHMIGPLQTNKVRYCPGLFTLIHSIDRAELMLALNDRGAKVGVPMTGLLQVNVSGEPQKSGCDPDEAEALLRVADGLTHLTIAGVMTVPPYADDPEEARPYFRALADLKDELARAPWRRVRLTEFSAGMTGDFEIAIEEGATLVRVGTAIFGERDHT